MRLLNFLKQFFLRIYSAGLKVFHFFAPTQQWLLVAVILTGIFIGLGAYTLKISKAASYLSHDPKTCINCHVMIPQYASWKRSSHARVAVCVDCHIPHDNFIHSYSFKMRDGLRHSYVFATRMEPQVIMIKEEGTAVVQENCIRCHQNVLQDTSLPQATYEAHKAGEGKLCWECHREVPHGRVHSLSSAPYALIPETEHNLSDWLKAYGPVIDQYRKHQQQGESHD